MSNLTSSSTSASDENFLGFDEDFIIDSDVSSDTEETPHVPFIDARRRLESMIDERNLEKDIKEFDFDF